MVKRTEGRPAAVDDEPCAEEQEMEADESAAAHEARHDFRDAPVNFSPGIFEATVLQQRGHVPLDHAGHAFLSGVRHGG